MLIRAVRSRNVHARDWRVRVSRGDVRGVVPDLVYVEMANALLVEHRVRGMPAHEVAIALERLLAIPLAVIPTRDLIRDALAIASARALSAYDACYVALAEANDAVLVTADRKLAAATTRSALIA